MHLCSCKNVAGGNFHMLGLITIANLVVLLARSSLDAVTIDSHQQIECVSVMNLKVW